MDFETTGVEEQEVAEPAEVEETETSAEEPEVAEPVSEEHQKTEADARFAEMRRAQQEAEKRAADAEAELEQLRTQSEARDAAFARITGRDEDGDIAALAELTGMSEDEVRAEMEAAEESVQKDLKIQQLEQEVMDIRVDKIMQEHLAEVQKIDPTIKSLAELPEEFDDYVRAGLSAKAAYWAVKGEEIAHRSTPPKPPGRVASGTAEKETYSEAEIDAMSSDQLKKNWKKVFNSWGK